MSSENNKGGKIPFQRGGSTKGSNIPPPNRVPKMPSVSPPKKD